MVFFRVSLFEQSIDKLRRFEQEVKLIGNIKDCYLISGEFDYLLTFDEADITELENIYSNIVTKLPGVHRVRSEFPLRKV